MNILLLEPPMPNGQPEARSLFKQRDVYLSAPWIILCIRAYIMGHTRHHCTLSICDDIAEQSETLLETLLPYMHSQDLIAIHASTHNVPVVNNILDTIKKHNKNIPTALFGSFPSIYPALAQKMEHCDFVVSGDPEPILRNILDFMDVPQRMSHTPGLSIKEGKPKPAAWLPSLDTLSLPEWERIHSSRTKKESSTFKIATARLSRGHPKTPAARAEESQQEPLRIWSYHKIIQCFQTCSIEGISLVALEDSPAFWTSERLNEWCVSATEMKNVQPWSIQLFPQEITKQKAEQLYQANCRRVHFVIPSCQSTIIKAFNGSLDFKPLSHSIKELRRLHIEPQFKVWLGGPEEMANEVKGVLAFLRHFSHVKTILLPFPYHENSALFASVSDSKKGATLAEIMEWLSKPSSENVPVQFWSGQKGVDFTTAAINYLAKTITRSPVLYLREWWKKARSIDLIQGIENRAIAWLTKNKNQSS